MTRLIVIGFGPLGQRVVRYALQRKSVEIAGVVDIDPAKIGKDVGTLSGRRKIGTPVSMSLADALKRRRADVALLTTVSSLKKLEPQVVEAARNRLDVVSTCEELSFPWRTAPTIAARLDRTCRRYGVTCLGTGVNPGFLMDFLPVILTAVNQRVRKVTVQRIQDASTRRVPFQQKIGAGLTRAEFRKKAAMGRLRHVGLPESVHMIAHALGWRLTKVTESLKPVIARRPILSGYRPIEPGMASGVDQSGRGYVGNRVAITLRFRAAVGEPKSYDRIEIRGEPDIVSTIEGGVNGDVATCAIVLNAVRSVKAADPGLKTMLDVPAVTFND